MCKTSRAPSTRNPLSLGLPELEKTREDFYIAHFILLRRETLDKENNAQTSLFKTQNIPGFKNPRRKLDFTKRANSWPYVSYVSCIAYVEILGNDSKREHLWNCVMLFESCRSISTQSKCA